MLDSQLSKVVEVAPIPEIIECAQGFIPTLVIMSNNTLKYYCLMF